jgi:hypothetical protein
VWYTNVAVAAETLLGVKDLLPRGVMVLPAEGVDDSIGFLIVGIWFLGGDGPRGREVINIFLVKVYYKSKYAVLGINLFKSDDLYIKGLEFIIEFNILASDEPDKGIL